MRLGKVRILSEYIVDLDNPDMIDHAKTCLYEDLTQAVIHSSFDFDWFEVIEAPEASESDIPEFLKDEDDFVNPIEFITPP